MHWILLATISAILSAASAIGEKKTLHRIKPLEYSFLLSIFILVFSLWIPLQVNVLVVGANAMAVLLAKSIFAAAGFLFVMKALEKKEISSTMPLLALSPGITALLALVAINEGLHSIEWLGLGLMMVGTYVLEIRPRQSAFAPFRTIFSSAGSQFLGGALLVYGVSGVADKFLIGTMHVQPLIVVFYQHIFFCLIYGFYMMWNRTTSIARLLEDTKGSFGLLVLVAALTVGYRATQLAALAFAPVGLVLAVKRTSVIYATLIGGRYFGERRLWVKVLAACIIVAAGFIILRNVG